ncbi:hypothetical protein AaE_001391 [Aphanomyces astaci]|uniref:RING-type domain-containing protein n=1 Tax=Aphanomyces astaci TaxID=112090 RepID=A0A6A5ACL1_APHAT|nr:hypothetical protein AaE_001391 [Aphanomyces astaci]
MSLPEKARNKRTHKVEKLHLKALVLAKKRDKAQWRQVLSEHNDGKLRHWQAKEASINTKISNVRADMLKKIQNPLELFPADQVAWHAAKFDADVNATNSFGFTPLLCAAEQQQADVVSFLTSLPRVDPYIRSTSGLLAIHVVRKGASLFGDKYGRYAKCSRALDARCAVIHGWLFESLRGTLLNRLVLENVGLKAHSWHQRYMAVLRTSATSPELEFVAYETPAPNVCPAVPVWVAVYRMGDPVTWPIPKRSLNNKPHTFSFTGVEIFPSKQAAATFEFAALSEEAFTTWMQFFEHAFIDASGMAPLSSSVEHGSIPVVDEVPFEDLFPPSPAALPLAKSLAMAPLPATRAASLEHATPAPVVEEAHDFAVKLSPSAPDFSMLPPASAPDPHECVVCFDGPQEGVCVPCGHHAVCMACARRLLAHPPASCPVCRGPVREIIRMFRC